MKPVTAVGSGTLPAAEEEVYVGEGVSVLPYPVVICPGLLLGPPTPWCFLFARHADVPSGSLGYVEVDGLGLWAGLGQGPSGWGSAQLSVI